MKKLLLILVGCSLMGCSGDSSSSIPNEYKNSKQPTKPPAVVSSGGADGAAAPPAAPPAPSVDL